MDVDSVLEELGAVDVCIVIDSTSSMSPFIEDAKRHAKKIAEEISAKGDLHLRVAIQAFRDHPPQDHTYVTWEHGFSDLARFQNAIDNLSAYGGGDIPEAVYDGLYAAAGLQWRENAEHLCYLIGDAPPHGIGLAGDGFPEGCPCGLTARGIIEVFSMHHITLHACAIGGYPITRAEFGEMAAACNGKLFDIDVTAPEMVTASIGSTLSATSSTISDSRIVYAAYAGGSSSVAEVSSLTGLSADSVVSSMSYLSDRGYAIPVTISETPDISVPPKRWRKDKRPSKLDS